MRDRRASTPKVRSEINVTPLVDVVLVLLIIFMLVTPRLNRDTGVQLPETPNPERMPESRKQLTVAIRADGSIRLGDRGVLAEELKTTLAGQHASAPDREVIVKADRQLPYGRVREVMRLLNEAGFHRVGLATERAGGGQA